ncbi:MAG: hypothetical protein IJN03_02545 [Bacilli bacterium]|nr:hypothetical protein [Bacilli bacterium]
MAIYNKVNIKIGNELYGSYDVHYLKDHLLEYNDDSCNTKIEIKEDEIKLIRENEEFLLIMNNTKEEAVYKLKELNYELEIKINYFDKIIEDNNLIISYQLETTDQPITLILEGE